MRMASFHLAMRSERAKEPTFRPGARQPTARWTMVTSSVSPERAETMPPKPAARAVSQADFASKSVPRWFGLMNGETIRLYDAIRLAPR